MGTSVIHWKRLFILCAGLFIGTAFCMKWMESDFLYKGSVFSILGLEIFYPKEKIMDILSGMEPEVRTILRYHLSFDFVFMAGVYPGIASLCMMARNKRRHAGIRKFLLCLALLQAVALLCDVAENYFLLKWISSPYIGNEFQLYHVVVYIKWVIALTGIFTAVPLLLRKSH